MSELSDSPVRRVADCSYAVSDDRVLVGASLGNGSAWIVGKATGAIQKMYSLKVDRDVMWSTVVTYGSANHRVLVGLGPDDRMPEDRLGQKGGHVILAPVAAGTFEYHPGFQRHRFELPSQLDVTEVVFVPRTGLEDPAVVYFIVDVHNFGNETRELTVHAYTKLAGTTPKDLTATYDAKLRALVAHNASHPDWVRMMGATVKPTGYQTMTHAAESYDPQNVPPLSGETKDTGDIIGAIGTDLRVAAGKTERVAFIQVFSEAGEAQARSIYEAALDVDGAFRRTEQWFGTCLGVAQILTPEKTINDGAYWAKVNMLRVLARYPQGDGFTNSPGSSAAVVGRDLAWFAYGCDYIDPATSRSMLLRFAQTQYDSGKMPEYYHAVTGEVEDYGLNINDDTPLFILACAHHYRTSGDDAFLAQIWPVVAKAADYILTQRDAHGLVVCTATGVEVRGIASWRNIIPHFTMNGAVTEINSECFAALLTVAQLARALAAAGADRRDEFEALAAHYSLCARTLRDAINKQLLNPKNGMYLLNIDLNGQSHDDVTGDEVFPVMFDVAPWPVAYRIISRLNTPDFQTEAGLRTVSRLSPDYTPYRDVGLIGGVWPGISFWYAFAAAKIYPDAMVRNLKAGYAHYLRDPKIYNTVPGQFSEWFDGESLVNRGIRLSPWEPPRYLWAAIEGACGLTLHDAPKRLRVAPLMPSGWTWLGVRRLPLLGRELSYFVIRDASRFRIFANGHLEVEGELEVFDEDVSDRIDRLDPDMVVLALRRRDEWLICIGSTLDVAYTFPLSLGRLLDERRNYLAHLYYASLGRWTEGETATGKDFKDIALHLEAHSFVLTRLVPVE
jgi:mannosylglycerate hydrolase MGH1-like protein